MDEAQRLADEYLQELTPEEKLTMEPYMIIADFFWWSRIPDETLVSEIAEAAYLIMLALGYIPRTEVAPI